MGQKHVSDEAKDTWLRYISDEAYLRRGKTYTGEMRRKIWKTDLLNMFSSWATQEIVLIKISKEGVAAKRK